MWEVERKETATRWPEGSQWMSCSLGAQMVKLKHVHCTVHIQLYIIMCTGMQESCAQMQVSGAGVMIIEQVSWFAL